DQNSVHAFLESERRRPAIAASQGQVPRWCDALLTMQIGDSIGCKLYQEPAWSRRESNEREHVAQDRTAFPFRRWLFWRHPGDDGWLPETHDSSLQITSLGTYGAWELGTASRACFNDFVILVQSVTPVAAEQSRQSP